MSEQVSSMHDSFPSLIHSVALVQSTVAVTAPSRASQPATPAASEPSPAVSPIPTTPKPAAATAAFASPSFTAQSTAAAATEP